MRRRWESLRPGRHILLAAEDGGRLVGSVMGVVCEELYGDGRPFLVVENLIVDKEQRRKGGRPDAANWRRPPRPGLRPDDPGDRGGAGGRLRILRGGRL